MKIQRFIFKIQNLLCALGLVLQVLILTHCATDPDVDYIVTTDEVGVSDPNTALAACEAQRYLTADCVTLISEEQDRLIEEQAAILLASQDLNNVSDCYDFEILSSGNGVESESTINTIDCASIATNLLNGFSVCVSQTTDQYYECSAIEDFVNTTIALCDASSDQITTDFCNLINPTADDAE